METLTLTTPITPPTRNTVKMIHIDLNVEDQTVVLQAKFNTGEVVTRREYADSAVALLSQLNTANLSVKSLQKRALEYMASKGDFAGTISGSPD